jgi:hypothetical protein
MNVLCSAPQVNHASVTFPGGATEQSRIGVRAGLQRCERSCLPTWARAVGGARTSACIGLGQATGSLVAAALANRFMMRKRLLRLQEA